MIRLRIDNQMIPAIASGFYSESEEMLHVFIFATRCMVKVNTL